MELAALVRVQPGVKVKIAAEDIVVELIRLDYGMAVRHDLLKPLWGGCQTGACQADPCPSTVIGLHVGLFNNSSNFS